MKFISYFIAFIAIYVGWTFLFIFSHINASLFLEALSKVYDSFMRVTFWKGSLKAESILKEHTAKGANLTERQIKTSFI